MSIYLLSSATNSIVPMSSIVPRSSMVSQSVVPVDVDVVLPSESVVTGLCNLKGQNMAMFLGGFMMLWIFGPEQRPFPHMFPIVPIYSFVHYRPTTAPLYWS